MKYISQDTTVHTPPTNNMSPAQAANMTEAFTQILSQVLRNNKADDMKQMMKNIKTFDETNKAECITWLSQINAASKFSSLSFRELICHLPRNGPINVTCINITLSNIHRPRDQGHDSSKLLRHPKHSRSSSKITKPTNVAE